MIDDAFSARALSPAYNRYADQHEFSWQHYDVTMRVGVLRHMHGRVDAELSVVHGGVELHFAGLDLMRTSDREIVIRKLADEIEDVPWRALVDRACVTSTREARRGEPIVTLTGRVTASTRELVPSLLYEGDPTLLYADGDTGKSLVALAVSVAFCAGVALPFGLRPARAVPVMYLDWETPEATQSERLGKIAAGLGIDPPPVFYKHMTRPLVDEARDLAAEVARRRIGLIVIDSMIFASGGGGEGGGFHEPVVAFYNALRSLGPAASLVLSHITNESAKNGTPARPFGGAFAFNAPRLIWELRRDRDVDDATAIVFTCRKANNLARKPEPFGLRFQPGHGTITIYPFDLADAAPQTVAGASIKFRVKVALARGPKLSATLAEELDLDPESVSRKLRDLRKDGQVRSRTDGMWELASS
jgi:AAA domain